MHHLIAKIVKTLKEKNLILTTVESCTGGGLANEITNIPGASEVFREGFVTYSNSAKIRLGVSPNIINTHTVYSTATAIAMAKSGLSATENTAQIGVGITGVLSREDPANPEGRLGDVYIAVVKGDFTYTRYLQLSQPNRIQAKEQAIRIALEMILDACAEEPSYNN
jgi:PncC family amidohydrolase